MPLLFLFKLDHSTISFLYLANTKAAKKILKLSMLGTQIEDWPSWSPVFGAFIAQAATMCLENQGHDLELVINIEGDNSDFYLLIREALSSVDRNFHADMHRSTEYGAYALSALLLPQLSNLTMVEVSKRGTGFDFWIGLKHDSNLPFQRKARIEVSGILSGDQGTINKRVKIKLQQISPTDNTSYPGYVSVVEFSTPKLVLTEKKAGHNE